MKLYRMSWQDRDEGSCLEWHSSKDSAVSARAKLRTTGVKNAEIEVLELDATKSGILAFLNKWLKRDNG
jgi:hypothetical protein